jgi:hypothetical protein
MSGRRMELLRAASVSSTALRCSADCAGRFIPGLSLAISPDLALIAKAATLTLSVVLLNVLSLRYGLANRRLHRTSSAAKVAL